MVPDGCLTSCCALGIFIFSYEWSHLSLSRGEEQGKVVRCGCCFMPDLVGCKERPHEVPPTCEYTILWLLSVSLEIGYVRLPLMIYCFMQLRPGYRHLVFKAQFEG